MADRPTVTQADRSEIQSRIDRSLNFILNGPGAFWPDGGSRPIHEIFGNLVKYRLGLPGVDDVNDPDGVYRSTLIDFDDKIREFGKKLQTAGKFPDDLDVLPPFPDDHIEVPPPSPLFPQPSQKDLLNKFNIPISYQPNGTPATYSSVAFDPYHFGTTSTKADSGSPQPLFTQLMSTGPVGSTQTAALPQSQNWPQASPPLQPDETPDATDNGPARVIGRRTYSLSDPSPFPQRPPLAPAPASPDGSLSFNDAYLEYLRRLNAN